MNNKTQNLTDAELQSINGGYFPPNIFDFLNEKTMEEQLQEMIANLFNPIYY